jgi:hypothetical protein
VDKRCVVMTLAEWEAIPMALKQTQGTERWAWFAEPTSTSLTRLPVYISAVCASALRDADRVWPDKAPA